MVDNNIDKEKKKQETEDKNQKNGGTNMENELIEFNQREDQGEITSKVLQSVSSMNLAFKMGETLAKNIEDGVDLCKKFQLDHKTIPPELETRSIQEKQGDNCNARKNVKADLKNLRGITGNLIEGINDLNGNLKKLLNCEESSNPKSHDKSKSQNTQIQIEGYVEKAKMFQKNLEEINNELVKQVADTAVPNRNSPSHIRLVSPYSDIEKIVEKILAKCKKNVCSDYEQTVAKTICLVHNESAASNPLWPSENSTESCEISPDIRNEISYPEYYKNTTNFNSNSLSDSACNHVPIPSYGSKIEKGFKHYGDFEERSKADNIQLEMFKSTYAKKLQELEERFKSVENCLQSKICDLENLSDKVDKLYQEKMEAFQKARRDKKNCFFNEANDPNKGNCYQNGAAGNYKCEELKKVEYCPRIPDSLTLQPKYKFHDLMNNKCRNCREIDYNQRIQLVRNGFHQLKSRDKSDPMDIIRRNFPALRIIENEKSSTNSEIPKGISHLPTSDTESKSQNTNRTRRKVEAGCKTNRNQRKSNLNMTPFKQKDRRKIKTHQNVESLASLYPDCEHSEAHVVLVRGLDCQHKYITCVLCDKRDKSKWKCEICNSENHKSIIKHTKKT